MKRGQRDEAKFIELRQTGSAEQLSLRDRCAAGGHRVSRADGQCLCGIFCTLEQFVK